MLVTMMKEKKTPKTMYRYSFRIRGLRVEKSKLLVFPMVEDVEPLEEVEDMEDMLTERP